MRISYKTARRCFMTKSGKTGLVHAAICMFFLVTALSGCDRSPKVYCTESEDGTDYKETGLTLKGVMKHLEKNKIAYKYDEKEKVLYFQTARIYFKDHASGLVAYKARQPQRKMDNLGVTPIQPQGEFVLDPCKLLELIKR
jgi:hypothetical protein